jgi:hypothetical protein
MADVYGRIFPIIGFLARKVLEDEGIVVTLTSNL